MKFQVYYHVLTKPTSDRRIAVERLGVRIHLLSLYLCRIISAMPDDASEPEEAPPEENEPEEIIFPSGNVLTKVPLGKEPLIKLSRSGTYLNKQPETAFPEAKTPKSQIDDDRFY
jgi:hypothetical protein